MNETAWRDVAEQHFPLAATEALCDRSFAFACFSTSQDAESVLSWVARSGCATDKVGLGLVALLHRHSPAMLTDAAYVHVCTIGTALLLADENARSVIVDAESFFRPISDGMGRRAERATAAMRMGLKGGLKRCFVRDAAPLADAAALRLLWHLGSESSIDKETAKGFASRLALDFLGSLAAEAAWRSYLVPWTNDLLRHAHKEVALHRLLYPMLQYPSIELVVHLERANTLDKVVKVATSHARHSEWKAILRRLRETWPCRAGGGDDGEPSQYVCPITLEACRFPARCSDGFVYERDVIMKIMCTTRASPCTREPLLPVAINVFRETPHDKPSRAEFSETIIA